MLKRKALLNIGSDGKKYFPLESFEFWQTSLGNFSIFMNFQQKFYTFFFSVEIS